MSEFTGDGTRHSKRNEIDFGDYVEIEMYRYGTPNVFFIHKVVGALRSNTWIEAPLKWDSEPVRHDHMEAVLNVIQSGIDETEVIRVAQKDVRKLEVKR